MKSNPRLRRERHTNPFLWMLAIICAILAIAVIITGLVVFIIYMVYQPKMPYIKVAYTQLLQLQYDRSGLLATQMIINLEADNNNPRAHATFSDIEFLLKFHQIDIAKLQSGPFDVLKNSSVPLNYTVASSPISLNDAANADMYASLQKDMIKFDLDGQARAQWRVGVFVSLKFWTHLSCKLQFFPSNGSSVGLDCNSKSN